MDYTLKAIQWAERYGIVEYSVKGNKMIFYVSYAPYLSNSAYSVKHIVNLDTNSETTSRLKRINKKGYVNR